MSVKNYRFVSPGVFVNEIDNSQLPASPAGIGPVIIGRAEKGPALRPTTVNSFEEFVNVFGTPNPGNAGDDVWRQGNSTTATTYGMYAAQAYLRNSSPLTFIRLLGDEDANATNSGKAGWTEDQAYGLFVFESAGNDEVDGALAAIFYAGPSVTFALSGTVAASGSSGAITDGPAITGSNLIIKDTGNANEFKMILGNAGASSADITASFNFNRNDSRYIRKVFNTNPQLTNAGITDTPLNYFLGETFDRHLSETVSDEGTTYAALVQLTNTGDSLSGSNFIASLQGAETPQIISCRLDPSDTPTDLFKFVTRGEGGDWSNKNIKISIQDIKRSTNNDTEYGTFSVVIRHLSDSDNVVRVIEQFNNCTLNPNSLDYVARKIGTQYREWEPSERRYRTRGDWPNNSQLVRIVMNSDVDAGLTNPVLLPFGFDGIVKYVDETIVDAASGSWISGSGNPDPTNYIGETLVISGSSLTANVFYPEPELRVSASDGNLANPTDAYFGFQTTQTAGGTVFDTSNIDLLRPRGGIVANMFDGALAGVRAESTQFTLDDISGSGVWSEGSYATDSLTFAAPISGVLDAGYDRFTVPVYGGFDGTDITQMDPFANATMTSSPSDTNSYEFFSIRKAIDSVADPEVVEMNLAAIPALTQEGLTTHLVRTCEDRGDALAVIDLPDSFQPREESTEVARLNTQSTITTLINGLRSRGLNSSYGCAYYPWVRARDTINGAFLWLPPSVAAIGTFSSSQRKTQVWFAPAGFNRGGLTEGSAGIPVVDVAHQLRRKDRDDLYGANINPIAKFPSEGVVIFGQKTLQVTPSALDRINVRRLMIFVKKRISQIASGILFDPNVKTTWTRFTSRVEPFLADVKTNFGLSDYRVVLDETTTTPDLVDRNILYAQIFLKPTRAIEFIAIDFNITRTGASFDD